MRFVAAVLVIGGIVAYFSSLPAAAHSYAPDYSGPIDFVLGGTVPGKWGPPVFGTPATVTWSLMPTGTSTAGEHPGTFTHLSGCMPAGFLAPVTAAFANWAGVSGLTFVQVADDGAAFNAAPADPSGVRGNIRLGCATFDGPFGVLAHAYFPPVNGVSAAGDLHYDIAEAWKIGFGGPGFDIFQVTAHEIGHSIGLNHTAVPGSLMNPFYTEAFSGVQADDIAGACFIYGSCPTDGVPEPASLTLLGTGLGLLVLFRRRAHSVSA